MCTSLLSLEKQVSSNQPHWPPCWHRYIHKACQNGIFHTLTTAFFYTGLLSWQSHLIPDLLQCGWFSSWRPLPDVSSLQMNVLPFGVVWFGPDLSKWVSPLLASWCWSPSELMCLSSCSSAGRHEQDTFLGKKNHQVRLFPLFLSKPLIAALFCWDVVSEVQPHCILVGFAGLGHCVYQWIW